MYQKLKYKKVLTSENDKILKTASITVLHKFLLLGEKFLAFVPKFSVYITIQNVTIKSIANNIKITMSGIAI